MKRQSTEGLKNFEIRVVEKYENCYSVYAKDYDEAVNKVKNQYLAGRIKLNSQDLKDFEIY